MYGHHYTCACNQEYNIDVSIYSRLHAHAGIMSIYIVTPALKIKPQASHSIYVLPLHLYIHV